MNENLIRQYFDGEISAVSLKPFLVSIRDVRKLKKGDNFICDLNKNFEITLKHLAKICHDYLQGLLDSLDVEAIAFFLVGSDHFQWDKGTEQGAVIAQIIDDWNNPEIAFPINYRNIKLISRGLDEGVYDTKTLSTGNPDH